MIEEKTKKNPRVQNSKKLTLSKDAILKGNSWLTQVSQHFNGMITLKRNDIINAVIESLDEELPLSLLEKIKQQRLTQKDIAKWIYNQCLEAEKNGSEVDLKEYLAQADVLPKKKAARRRTKTSSDVKKSETLSTLKMGANEK